MKMFDQRLTDALNGLKLTTENREIGEMYLDLSQEEDRRLPGKVSVQDFSQMTDMEKEACRSYCMAMKDAGEELTRYLQFVTAVGGASACYVR